MIGLSLRITTVAYWKQRLTTEHNSICQEITNLNMSKQKTQQALASTELPTEVQTTLESYDLSDSSLDSPFAPFLTSPSSNIPHF